MPNLDPQTTVTTGTSAPPSPAVSPVTQIVYVNEAAPPITPVAGDGITHYSPLASAASDGVMSAQDKVLLDGLVADHRNALTRHEFIQSVPSTLWTIIHNLNGYPEVEVFDDTNEQILANVTYVNNETITVAFSQPYSGKVILI